MYEQSYTFTFEAAHDLADNVKGEDDHPYARIHGHSFVATLTLRADRLGPEGWIMDFARLREVAADLHDRLDHRLLNTIAGLERPTLENLAAWIHREAASRALALARVELARPSLNERVAFEASARKS